MTALTTLLIITFLLVGIAYLAIAFTGRWKRQMDEKLLLFKRAELRQGLKSYL